MGSDVRAKMKQAMLRLLERKHYLQITVTDLVKEAGVARASFYRIYSSVDGIIDEIIKDIADRSVENLIPVLLTGGEESIKSIITTLLDGLRLKKIPYIGLLPENAQMFTNRFVQNSIFANQRDFKNLPDKYLSTIHLYMILAVANTWAYHGYKETASELADFIYGYIFEGKYRKSF